MSTPSASATSPDIAGTAAADTQEKVVGTPVPGTPSNRVVPDKTKQ